MKTLEVHPAFSKKEIRRMFIQCPGPQCERCALNGVEKTATKIVLGQKLCQSCAQQN